MTEHWLPVVGFEAAYQVSDQGRVRSINRVIRSRTNWHQSDRVVRTRVLRPVTRSGGYLGVTLSKGGTRSQQLIHRLVLAAFRGSQPEGMESLHGNGQRDDNRLSNLRWGTPRENQEDRRRHGRTVGPVPGEVCRNGHRYADTGVVLIQGVRRCKQCQIDWRKANRR